MQLINPVQLAYTAEITRYTILYILRPLELQKGRGTPRAPRKLYALLQAASKG